MLGHPVNLRGSKSSIFFPSIGCKKSFKSLSEFRTHKRVSHKPRIKSKVASSSTREGGSSRCHRPSVHYYCTQCNKKFKSVGSLKTHMISHMSLPALPKTGKKDSEVPESISKGVFTCRICNTCHVTWSEFSKHFQKVHGTVPKILLQYKCVPCDLLFQTKDIYLEHNRTTHASSNNTKIVVFNNTNQGSGSYNNNNVTTTSMMTTVIEKKHICTICSRAFKRSDNLKAHARTVHYKLKANNCTACGKGYRTKNELLRHLDRTCPFRSTELSFDHETLLSI